MQDEEGNEGHEAGHHEEWQKGGDRQVRVMWHKDVQDRRLASMAEKDEFDWGLYPDLEKFVISRVNYFLSHNAFAKQLSDKMLSQSSTKFVDWIDHMVIPDSSVKAKELEKLGLEVIDTQGDPDGATVYKHNKSYLFPILVSTGRKFEVAIKPEEIDHLLQYLANGVGAEGEPYSPYRRAILKSEGNYILSAVERRGYNGFIVEKPDDIREYLDVLSKFYHRQRYFEDDSEGMAHFEKNIKNSLIALDNGRAADAFFRAEGTYWQSRNRAGQVQKARQDTLGLGWGNHDHHTYRSSRTNFTRMINIFERLGYDCRERYYAGERAGWGAQIMEHKVCDIVVFTDVDLNPDETEIDFAHRGFSKREEKLGTVGLWIGLHGESIMQAGMHHLEARFDHDNLTQELPKYGISVMPPFSRFDFLKQAFTVGERWQVDKKRLDKLLKDKYITKIQYDEFLKVGAIGSHMENLERDEGFKGFNKASVTKIILETDPRAQHSGGA